MRHLSVVALLLTLGCQGELMADDAGGFEGRTDATAPDGGAMGDGDGGPPGPGDAGRVDAAPSDAAALDAASFDAGPVDAGPVDAGPVDSGPPPGPSSSRHTPRPLGSTSANRGFWEYLPPRYGDGAGHPLLVFLHGLGENGDGDAQLDRVLRVGPPRLIEADAWPNERPFIVLSPQKSGGGCPNANEIQAFLTYAIGAYDVDPARVYLTGLSCGGIGAWNYLGAHLDSQIAAMVPIAGDGRGAFRRSGCALGTTPIWAFHGDSDGTVSPRGTTEPMADLMACTDPAPDALVTTIYPGVGHNSWRRTYDLSAGHDIYAWMLRFTNP